MVKFKLQGFNRTLTNLESSKETLRDKLDYLMLRLADVGMTQAKLTYANSTFIDNADPITVSIEQIPDGYAIVARGEQVAFVEFGAGVFYNGAESYKFDRPPEVAGIGEYGQGRGKQEMWLYKDASGNKQWTRGNPPANAMFYAYQEMQTKFESIAREIFR